MRFTEGKVATILRRHNYKLTPQRRAVIRTIASSHDHLTPVAIYERVHQEYPNIGLVTIYRTLTLLAGLKLICQLHTEDSCPSYTISTPKHHHHVICANCGKVVDFTGYDITRLEQRLSVETGFKIDSHVLEFTGLCPVYQEEAN